ncbi:MAG: hypothetical protein ACOC0E_09205 [Spirochaetota bacterium]
MLLRKRNLVGFATIVLVFALGGCHFAYLPGEYDYDYDDSDGRVDPDLLAVTSPDGGVYAAGETLQIAWDGSDQPSSVDIEINLGDTLYEPIARNVRNNGGYSWTIPSDFGLETEIADEYQIVVSGYHPDQATGSLKLAAYSSGFTIVPSSSDGLTDVRVSQRLIEVTLTDNGMEIDGDTVDLYLNGELVAENHVLEAAGTTFALTLRAGDNVFEVHAVNEGTVTPNTALLEISHVVDGPTAQEWRLYAGETGSLTITAP